MAQTANNPVPGDRNTRGVGTVATADKNQRKTGYRPDGKFSATDNNNAPDSLVRTVTDPRLA